MADLAAQLDAVRSALAAGRAAPYLGAGVLALAGADSPLPGSAEALAARLTAKISVPHKIRSNLGAAAQFIENFKHRRTLVAAMKEAFAADVPPTALQAWLAQVPKLPLVTHAWYDDLVQKAFAGRASWGLVQGVSQSEHFGSWTHSFQADGARIGTPDGAAPAEVAGWATLLYEPFGAIAPAANFLVSDTDFVEVLTEIDIQTPIPEEVQNRRRGLSFLFLGCRFATQGERIFASQIIKRSSDRHWAVLPEPPTRNELRFLETFGVERIDAPLAEVVERLAAAPVAA
jgi:hypothetical protein